MFFFIVNVLCFSTGKNNSDDKLIVKNHSTILIKSYQEETNEKIDGLNARIESLEKVIKYRPTTQKDNGGYIYNLDQIYSNSLRYYESTIKNMKWYFSILGSVFLAFFGLVKWDSEKKLKEEKGKIYKNIEKFEEEVIKINRILKELKQMKESFKIEIEKTNEKMNYKYQFTLALVQETNEMKKKHLENFVVPLANTQTEFDKIVLYNTLGDLTKINEEKINYYSQAINLWTDSINLWADLIDLSKEKKLASNYFERGILFKRIANIYINSKNEVQFKIFLTKAINDFGEAIHLNQNQNYIFEKAEALISIGKIAENANYYIKALDLIEGLKDSSKAFFLNGKIRYMLAIDSENNVEKQKLLQMALVSLDDAINNSNSQIFSIKNDSYLFKYYINFELGNILKEDKYFEKAIRNLDEIDQSLFVANTYLLKAKCEAKLLRYEEAIRNYDKTLELDPYNLNALNGKAIALYKNKIFNTYTDTDRAIKYFELIIKKDCKFWSAYNNLAEIYIEKNDFKKAIINLYQCLSLEKDLNIEITKDSYEEFLKFLAKEEENEKINLIIFKLKHKKGFKIL